MGKGCVPHQDGLSWMPVAERLNPSEATCAQRPFDPTFVGVGWGHKRLHPTAEHDGAAGRAKPGETVGKRTFAAAAGAGVELRATELPAVEPSLAKGALVHTKFTRGFNRRRQHTTEDERAAAEERKRAVQEHAAASTAARRERLAREQTRGGCNLLTCGPPIVGVATEHKPPKLTIKPKCVIERRLGAGEKAAEQRAKTEQMAARRREWLRCDGQPPERRQWTVREQLQCYDGYTLPPNLQQTYALPNFRFGKRHHLQPPAPSNVFGGSEG